MESLPVCTVGEISKKAFPMLSSSGVVCKACLLAADERYTEGRKELKCSQGRKIKDAAFACIKVKRGSSVLALFHLPQLAPSHALVFYWLGKVAKGSNFTLCSREATSCKVYLTLVQSNLWNK